MKPSSLKKKWKKKEAQLKFAARVGLTTVRLCGRKLL